MAEIELQHRKRPVWPWVLGVLVVALAIWGIAELATPAGDEVADAGLMEEAVQPALETEPVEPATATTDETPEAVAEYARIARGFATADMDRQHEYTANAIQQLVPALESILASSTVDHSPLEQHLDALRAAADGIQQTPWTAETHANEVKSAFTATADLLTRLQQDLADAGGERGVTRVHDAADALVANEPLLDQRDTVQRFFSASADAIERLARRS